MDRNKVIGRIQQIVDLGVPHTALGGNKMSLFGDANAIIHLMWDDVPEVKSIMFLYKDVPFPLGMDTFRFRKGKKFFEALAVCKGGDAKPEEFTKENNNQLDPSKIVLHGFYNPDTDMTHFFILPK